MSRLVTATIHLDALRHNLARIRQMVAPAQVVAVVKANAYGHGLERVARALVDAQAFAVASIAEGQRLRAAGMGQRIVVLSGPDCPSDLAELRRLRLEAVIHHASQLEWLEADHGGVPINVWLMVDSGMHRLGFVPDEVATVHARLERMAAVARPITLATHFAASDEFDNPYTANQIAAFDHATTALPGPRSLSNSAAVLGWPGARGDWVRTGGLLYGLSVVAGKSGADFGLRPAMTLTTHLIAINTVPTGARVGYGSTWEAPEPLRLGVAAVGYGDGYPRGIGSDTPVLVNGQHCTIAGRVSMDLLTIDLRNAPAARVGDRVTLWGNGLSVETVAEHARTISYDLTCGVTRRVLFVDDDG